MIQGISCNTPKMFLIVPCPMCNRCWKFHENPFIHFPVMLLTDTDSPENIEKEFLCSMGQMELPKNVSDCFWCQVPPTLKIAWKSVEAFFCNVANRQTDKKHQRWKHYLRRSAEVIRCEKPLIVTNLLVLALLLILDKHLLWILRDNETCSKPRIAFFISLSFRLYEC